MKTNTSFKLINLIIAGVIALSVNAQPSSASSEVPLSPNQNPIGTGPILLPSECNVALPDGMTPNSWMFAVNFNTSQAAPKGCMVVWDAQAKASKQTVACTNQGAVTISAGQATFNGSNYLECPFNLNNYIAGLPANINYSNLTMEARYLTMWNSGSSYGENPVFTHPSIRYSLPVDWAAAKVGLTTHIGSDWLGWHLTGNLPAADQINQPDGWIARSELRQLADNTLQVKHISSNPKDGAKWSGGSATPPGVVSFKTNASIMIGKANTFGSPLYLQGSLDKVVMMHVE